MANTLANPHSHGYLGNNLNNIIDESRQLILQHFGADSNEYSVIFTSGATGSIKLIGECFPWTSKSVYAYPYNSHTSIIGLREYASSVYCIPSNSLRNLTSNEQSDTENRTIGNREGYSLLAIPGECNFSGTKYSPYVISQLFSQISEKYLLTLKSSQVKFTNNTAESETNWLWLLDASKLASTHSINISLDYSPFHRPDFICCSFYKIFGFPTGIGALLVKKKVAHLLQKRYFPTNYILELIIL